MTAFAENPARNPSGEARPGRTEPGGSGCARCQQVGALACEIHGEWSPVGRSPIGAVIGLVVCMLSAAAFVAAVAWAIHRMAAR